MSSGLCYPLRFEPLYKRRVWGGRRLETVLGRQLPDAEPIGEAWEVCDHGHDSSRVVNGPLGGRTLGSLMCEHADLVLGPARGSRACSASGTAPQFPLLVKWIDARERLSVQVHPADGHPHLPPGEGGKAECWFVAEADPGARVYVGLRRGIDRGTLERELLRGSAELCLNAFDVRPGDFFFVPAGTVHAIGGGVLLAEIQRSSDTTFRLFDWNRVDPATGRPRTLHVESALDAIHYGAPAVRAVRSASEPEEAHVTLLGAEQCPHFVVARHRLRAGAELGEPERFHILVCLAGAGRICGGAETVALRRGDSVLLPAAGPFRCDPDPELHLLDAWVPLYLGPDKK